MAEQHAVILEKQSLGHNVSLSKDGAAVRIAFLTDEGVAVVMMKVEEMAQLVSNCLNQSATFKAERSFYQEITADPVKADAVSVSQIKDQIGLVIGPTALLFYCPIGSVSSAIDDPETGIQ